MSGEILEIVSSWRPKPMQEPVLENDAGIDVVVTGVGGGKTQIAAEKALRWAIELPGSSGLILGPDLNQVTDILFETFLEHARLLSVPADALVLDVTRGQDPRIVMWNGTVIYGRSGTDPDRLRNYGFHWMWMDEAAVQREAAFAIGIQRQRSAERIRAIVTTSPRPGWIWRVVSGEDPAYSELRRTTPTRVHRWDSSENDSNNAEVLAGVSAALEAVSPGMATQDVKGLFLGTREAPGTGPIMWEPAFCGPVVLKSGESRRAHVVGIDLGKTEDYMWATGLNGSGLAIAMDRWNANEVEVPLAQYWHYSRKRAAQFVRTHGATVVVVDTAKGGDQFAAALREELGPSFVVIEVATDSPGKKSGIIEAVGMAMPLGKVRVPSSWKAASDTAPTPVAHVEKLRMEFLKLQVTALGDRRRFDHPAGGHDDGVVSLALAWHGLLARPAAREGWIGAPTQPSTTRRF